MIIFKVRRKYFQFKYYLVQNFLLFFLVYNTVYIAADLMSMEEFKTHLKDVCKLTKLYESGHPNALPLKTHEVTT